MSGSSVRYLPGLMLAGAELWWLYNFQRLTETDPVLIWGAVLAGALIVAERLMGAW